MALNLLFGLRTAISTSNIIKPLKNIRCSYQTADAEEWKCCYRLENPDPPWNTFVETVLDRFQEITHLNLVQFKHVNQTSSVNEYIREFQKAKSRLLIHTDIKNEYHYVWNFIGGLREDIQKSINLLKPKYLNKAFNFALEIEESINPVDKRVEFIRQIPVAPTKAPLYLTYKHSKPVENNVRPIKEPIQAIQTTKVNLNPRKPNFQYHKSPTNYTSEQKKALGLCYKCSEK
jgi:Ty3 transposon capsid-like protein